MVALEDAKDALRRLGVGGSSRELIHAAAHYDYITLHGVGAGRREIDNGAVHYVYILESVRRPTEKYVGCTHDLNKRLIEHNAGKSPHSAKHRPWNLVCYHAFADERLALKFERYLKSGSGHEFRRRHFGV